MNKYFIDNKIFFGAGLILVILAFLQGKFFGYGVLTIIMFFSYIFEENNKEKDWSDYLGVYVAIIGIYEILDVMAIYDALFMFFIFYSIMVVYFVMKYLSNKVEEEKKDSFNLVDDDFIAKTVGILVIVSTFAMFSLVEKNIFTEKTIVVENNLILDYSTKVSSKGITQDDYEIELVLKNQTCDAVYEVLSVNPENNFYTYLFSEYIDKENLPSKKTLKKLICSK